VRSRRGQRRGPAFVDAPAGRARRGRCPSRGLESLAFVWVHARYREVPPIVVSAVLGLLMAFLAYGLASG